MADDTMNHHVATWRSANRNQAEGEQQVDVLRLTAYLDRRSVDPSVVLAAVWNGAITDLNRIEVSVQHSDPNCSDAAAASGMEQSRAEPEPAQAGSQTDRGIPDSGSDRRTHE